MNYKKTPIIEPEKLSLESEYTFTISPDDSMQYWDESNGLQRLNKFIDQWTTFLLKHVSPYAEYELHAEISRTGRLHFHGIIKFLSILDFYLYSIHKLSHRAQIEIDTITDKEIWMKYCTKQTLINKKIKSPRLPIKITILDYLKKDSHDECDCGSNH